MALFPCPECSTRISDQAQSCPNCGWVVKKELLEANAKVEEGRIAAEAAKRETERAKYRKDKKDNRQAYLILSVVAVVFLAMVIWGKSKEKPLRYENTPADATPTEAIVHNDKYDGSVWQVVDYVKKNTREPSSVKFIEWSELTFVDGAWIVRAKYRAKNGFGGYTVETTIFRLDQQGNVTGSQTIDRF